MSTRFPAATLKAWSGGELDRSSYPLQAIASSRAPDHGVSDGGFMVLTVELAVDGMPWLGAGPAFARGA